MADYCTNWPDSIDGVNFGDDCCADHDKAYAMGGVWRKLKADFKLAECVWKKGKEAKNWYIQATAVKMYAGVSVFGWWFWLKCRFEK